MQVDDVLRATAALVVGFLLGGIPFGVIVPRLAGGPDPRTIGSGRIGGANVSRAVGFRWAALSGLLDVAKAAMAVLIFLVAGWGIVPEVAAALAAIVGHSRSPYIGFKGGRGVAPATGGALVIAPLIIAVIAPVFFIVALTTRYSSLGSLAGSGAGGAIMVAAAALMPLPPIYLFYGIAAPGLIWLFHYDNIQRLLAGQERRFGSPPTPRASGGSG